MKISNPPECSVILSATKDLATFYGRSIEFDTWEVDSHVFGAHRTFLVPCTAKYFAS
jgi:hypothetical protein